MIKIHLGSGYEFIDGWVNVDMVSSNRSDFIKWDLSKGLPPQFEHGTIDFIFSQHFLEHLSRDHALVLMKDCYKKLKYGGVIRTVVPDLDVVVKRYVNNDLPTGGPGAWLPKNKCIMINQSFHAWGHQFLYNSEELLELLKEAGFNKFMFPEYKQSLFSELCGVDVRPPDDLRIEAIK